MRSVDGHFCQLIPCDVAKNLVAGVPNPHQISMQFTYNVGVDENKRQGAERLGNELVTISHILLNATRLVN